MAWCCAGDITDNFWTAQREWYYGDDLTATNFLCSAANNLSGSDYSYPKDIVDGHIVMPEFNGVQYIPNLIPYGTMTFDSIQRITPQWRHYQAEGLHTTYPGYWNGIHQTQGVFDCTFDGHQGDCYVSILGDSFISRDSYLNSCTSWNNSSTIPRFNADGTKKNLAQIWSSLVLDGSNWANDYCCGYNLTLENAGNITNSLVYGYGEFTTFFNANFPISLLLDVPNLDIDSSTFVAYNYNSNGFGHGTGPWTLATETSSTLVWDGITEQAYLANVTTPDPTRKILNSCVKVWDNQTFNHVEIVGSEVNLQMEKRTLANAWHSPQHPHKLILKGFKGLLETFDFFTLAQQTSLKIVNLNMGTKKLFLESITNFNNTNKGTNRVDLEILNATSTPRASDLYITIYLDYDTVCRRHIRFINCTFAENISLYINHNKDGNFDESTTVGSGVFSTEPDGNGNFLVKPFIHTYENINFDPEVAPEDQDPRVSWNGTQCDIKMLSYTVGTPKDLGKYGIPTNKLEPVPLANSAQYDSQGGTALKTFITQKDKHDYSKLFSGPGSSTAPTIPNNAYFIEFREIPDPPPTNTPPCFN